MQLIEIALKIRYGGLTCLAAALSAVQPAYAVSSPDCVSLGADHRFIGPPKAGTTTITSTSWVPATASVAEHCGVNGYATTGNRLEGYNRVNIQVDLPTDWNGRLYFIGNTGFAGSLQGMSVSSDQLTAGYATAQTDTGHQGSSLDASWAQDNPTKIKDFGYRGVHRATRAAKAILKAYYGESPHHSYFEGCSRGGGQALMEAQRYPGDFDGVIAGAPAYDWSHFMMGFAWGQARMFPSAGDIGEPRLPDNKLAYIESRVSANCDAIDGIIDGIIDDPRKCRFDCDRDLAICAAGSEASPSCLTPDQIETAKAIYSGPSNTSGQIFPGFPPGGEGGAGGWSAWITGFTGFPNLFGPGIPNLHHAFAGGFFKYLAYADRDDGSFDFRDFDFETDVDSLGPIGRILNASNPNLRKFRKLGGKLLIWTGWNDPAITSLGTLKYFDRVVDAMGSRTTNGFVRMYLLPGVYHCGGGPGPDTFDRLTAMVQWAEMGIAPQALIATNSSTGLQRPLCPYPQVARLIDANSNPTRAASFQCVIPPVPDAPGETVDAYGEQDFISRSSNGHHDNEAQRQAPTSRSRIPMQNRTPEL